MAKRNSKPRFVIPEKGSADPKPLSFKIPAYMYDDLNRAAEVMRMKPADLMAQIFTEYVHPILRRDLSLLQAEQAARDAAQTVVAVAKSPVATQSEAHPQAQPIQPSSLSSQSIPRPPEQLTITTPQLSQESPQARPLQAPQMPVPGKLPSNRS